MNKEHYDRMAAGLDEAAGIDNEALVHEELDNHRNAPRPDPACLYGLVGDVARAGGETTEANPYAIAANFIAYMSCAVGRGPFMPIGNTWHHCRQFTLHIGRSGRGRKGDAVSLVTRIDKALRELSQDAAFQVHRGGLSSREGLVFFIHDGYKEGKKEVEPIHDKRLWVVESEFANVLQQGKRDGNTLSSALRDCWDGVCLKPATKSNRLFASNPHIGLSGAVTPGELLSLMAARELSNGFANRFLMFWAERSKIIPFPRATPQDTVDELAQRVLAVLTFCESNHWVERDKMRVELTPDAKILYEKLYRGELNDNSAGERITALLERRAPMLLRMAMLFALCDLQGTVDVQHINAALAWIRFSVESVKFVFASAADEVAVEETNDTATKIARYLGEVGKSTRKQLTADCFKGHATKTRIDAALDELLSSNPPRISVESVPRPKGSPGSATKIYRIAAANSANCANSEQPRGSQDNSEVRELCELIDRGEQEFATVSKVRAHQNQAQARTNADDSLSSLSSPEEAETEVEL
jgi:hypothetical protein